MRGAERPVLRPKESLDEVRRPGLPDEVYGKPGGGSAAPILELGE